MLTLKIAQDTIFKASTDSSTALPANQKAIVKAGESLQVKSYQKKSNHYFVQLAEIISPIGAAGYFSEDHVQIEEIRGVWLTNVDSDILESEENIKEGLKQLKELGFNTIYPVVWQRGFTLYPSDVANRVFGAAIYPDKKFKDRDMLAELIKEAESHGFRVIPWFEYGLMAPSDSLLVSKKPEFLTQDRNGNESLNDENTCWLNPSHPDVQNFMSDLIAEVVHKYPTIDGIQLDDHFGMPVEMGYDPFTLKLFKDETGAVNPLNNPNSSLWKKWRTDKVTDLLRKVFKSVKAKNENCIISISPNPLGFSQSKFLADWFAWEQEGFAEELVIQLYRDDLSAFIGELNKPEVITARNHIPTVIGILTGLKNKGVNFSTIEEQVTETRSQDFAGFAFFFFGSLFNFAPETPDERVTMFKKSLSHDIFV
jgi:uncharacterized lipoprotein YddW (UPF0748 family)